MLDDHVADVVDDVAVAAGAADQGVRAGAAVEGVVAGIADQGVVLGVAEEGEVAGADDGDVFEILQVALVQVDGALGGRVERDLQAVGAFVGQFLDQGELADLVDTVGVVALAADQGVQARAADQLVVAVVADDDVVQRVADAVDVAGAGQGEVLDVGAEGVVHGGADGVDLAGQGAGLADHVADVVDDVNVVAQAADHQVGAGAAVQHVVAVGAPEDVVQRVAGGVEGAADQVEVLQVGAQGVVDVGVHRIDVAGRRALLDDHIADVVDDIAVVAGAAFHDVRAGAAVEGVVQGIAGQGVVECRAGGVFDLRAEGNGQPLVEGVARLIGEGLADLAVLAFVEVDADGRQLVAGIDRVDAAGVPDGFEHGLRRCPGVDVVAGRPLGIGAVQALDRQNVEHHGGGRQIGIVVVVAHDREARVIELRIKRDAVVNRRGERMLEADRMADLMDERHEIVGAFVGRWLIGVRADPDVAGVGGFVRRVGPSCGAAVQQRVAAEAQVAHACRRFARQLERDVGHGGPGAQRCGHRRLLRVGQRIGGLGLVVGAVVGGEDGSARHNETVRQTGYGCWRPPLGAFPFVAGNETVDGFDASQRGERSIGVTSRAGHADFLSRLRPFLKMWPLQSAILH